MSRAHGRHRERQSVWLVFLALCALLAAPSWARADGFSFTDQDLQAIAAWMYDGAGQPVPPVDPSQQAPPDLVPPSLVSELAAAEQDMSPALERQAWRLRARTGLLLGPEWVASNLPRPSHYAIPDAFTQAAASGQPVQVWWRVGGTVDGHSKHQTARIWPPPAGTTGYDPGNPHLVLKGNVITGAHRDQFGADIVAPDDVWAWGGHLVGFADGNIGSCDHERLGPPGAGNEMLDADVAGVCEQFVGSPLYWVPIGGVSEVPVQRIDVQAPHDGDMGPAAATYIGTDNWAYGAASNDVEARSRIASRFTEHADDYRDLIHWLHRRLHPIDFAPLLREYAPALQYEGEEAYYAMGADTAAENVSASGCEDAAGFAMTNALHRGSDDAALAAADPACGPALGMSWLVPAGTTYPGSSGTIASADDYIDEASDYQGDSANLYLTSGSADRVYGRVVDTADGLWLQYWLWYYYDDGHAPANSFNHEGDWENVRIKLDPADLQPVSATYAQHKVAEKCLWSSVEHTGTHPVVYVATDTHASYFWAGVHSLGNPFVDDFTSIAGPRMSSNVSIIGTTADWDWLRWPGRWGASGRDGGIEPQDSPVGPMQHTKPWNSPGQWDDDAGDCTPPRTGPGGGGERRAASPSGSLSVPAITATRSGASARVVYRAAQSSDERALVLTVHSPNPRVPPRKVTVDLAQRRSGTAKVPLPAAPGPYTVHASIVSTGNRSPIVETALR